MLIAVLSCFVLAAAAPALHRHLSARWTAWVLAVLPGALTVYFATLPAPQVQSYEWVPALGVRLSFAFDGLARLFALLISGIGTLVLIYAGPYMHGHPRLGRFYLYLLVFMGSMLGVVLADNVLLLFIFWELTSVSSFLLIGFDHHLPESRASALQSLLVTAGGGLALLAGLVLLGYAGGSFELSVLSAAGDAVRDHALYVPLLFLILAGAFTKSAQTPFHFWLPNAMAAPTPVSAYLHSSTMVKAGIYLMARTTPVLADTAVWHIVVGGVGAVTMVTGAVLACAQTDLKRLLAYATVSALGIMTMLLGLGGQAAAVAVVMFLLAHAFYKGALFLVAGGLVHATHERDVTRLGGLRRAMPITAAAGMFAAVSMAGAPPLAGFLGKELALDVVWHVPTIGGLLMAATALASALLVTVALTVGLGPFVGPPRSAEHAHEGPVGLWVGALVLAAVGLVAGLVPWLVVEPLVAEAAHAIGGSEAIVTLTLWHGWNVPLLMGTLSLVTGAGLYTQMPRLRTHLVAPLVLGRAGPAALYQHALGGLFRVADLQTRIIQSGYLRRYLLLTIGVAIALVGTSLVLRRVPISLGATDVRLYEVALAAAVLLGAVGTINARSNLGAVAALGTVGFGMALVFAMFGAPDLAMTQLVVEALLVIMFVLVLYDVPKSERRSGHQARGRDWMVAGTVGVLMTLLVLVAVTVRVEPPVSGYFVEQSVPLAHGHNVVNVILVDFRALDTLGEIAVIALAGIGVRALIKLRPGRPQA
jgi:multicomponent Na+:H+ antiporter subunit A